MVIELKVSEEAGTVLEALAVRCGCHLEDVAERFLELCTDSEAVSEYVVSLHGDE